MWQLGRGGCGGSEPEQAGSQKGDCEVRCTSYLRLGTLCSVWGSRSQQDKTRKRTRKRKAGIKLSSPNSHMAQRDGLKERTGCGKDDRFSFKHVGFRIPMGQLKMTDHKDFKKTIHFLFLIGLY